MTRIHVEPERECVNNGAPATRRATERSPIPIKIRKPRISFFTVIMASGMAQARSPYVRTYDDGDDDNDDDDDNVTQ